MLKTQLLTQQQLHRYSMFWLIRCQCIGMTGLPLGHGLLKQWHTYTSNGWANSWLDDEYCSN